MNYFVTVEGTEVLSNVSQSQAVEHAKKVKAEICCIGIGRKKLVKGKWMYSLLPLSFYIF